MATDKNNPNNKNGAGQQQTVQNAQTPINPFHDTEAKEPQPSVEEETELEQQRKEAMTERD